MGMHGTRGRINCLLRPAISGLLLRCPPRLHFVPHGYKLLRKILVRLDLEPPLVELYSGDVTAVLVGPKVANHAADVVPQVCGLRPPCVLQSRINLIIGVDSPGGRYSVPGDHEYVLADGMGEGGVNQGLRGV